MYLNYPDTVKYAHYILYRTIFHGLSSPTKNRKHINTFPEWYMMFFSFIFQESHQPPSNSIRFPLTHTKVHAIQSINSTKCIQMPLNPMNTPLRINLNPNEIPSKIRTKKSTTHPPWRQPYMAFSPAPSCRARAPWCHLEGENGARHPGGFAPRIGTGMGIESQGGLHQGKIVGVDPQR